MVIYKITNKINGKAYIGQTIQDVEKRWRRHCSNCENKSAISKAIKKYGKDNFTFEVIEENIDNIELLNSLEVHYISVLNTMYPSGYNLMLGGDNRTLSDETRKKMSEAKKEKPMSDEHKQKIREGIKKYWEQKPKKQPVEKVYVDRKSPEYILKMSSAKKGKKVKSRTRNSNNKTGKNGVFFRKDKGSCGAYIAYAMIEGKLKSKTFGCKIMGKEVAFLKACDWRNLWEINNEFNTKNNII